MRLERGWLVAAADGALSKPAAADFERCLELPGTDPLDDELIETRLDLVESYVMRADLRRARASSSSRCARTSERSVPWFELMVDIWFGIVSWLRWRVRFGPVPTRAGRRGFRREQSRPDGLDVV